MISSATNGREAAPIEHGLMCCYLYAAHTMKRGASAGLAEQ